MGSSNFERLEELMKRPDMRRALLSLAEDDDDDDEDPMGHVSMAMMEEAGIDMASFLMAAYLMSRRGDDD